jgi:hypothetical protein
MLDVPPTPIANLAILVANHQEVVDLILTELVLSSTQSTFLACLASDSRTPFDIPAYSAHILLASPQLWSMRMDSP